MASRARLGARSRSASSRFCSRMSRPMPTRVSSLSATFVMLGVSGEFFKKAAEILASTELALVVEPLP